MNQNRVQSRFLNSKAEAAEAALLVGNDDLLLVHRRGYSNLYVLIIKKIGVNDTFGYSGPAVELLKKFGLSAENIQNTTKEFLGK